MSASSPTLGLALLVAAGRWRRRGPAARCSSITSACGVPTRCRSARSSSMRRVRSLLGLLTGLSLYHGLGAACARRRRRRAVRWVHDVVDGELGDDPPPPHGSPHRGGRLHAGQPRRLPRLPRRGIGFMALRLSPLRAFAERVAFGPMKGPGPLLATGRDSDIFEYGPGLVLRRSREGHSMAMEARTMAFMREQGYPVPAVEELSDDGFDTGDGADRGRHHGRGNRQGSVDGSASGRDAGRSSPAAARDRGARLPSSGARWERGQRSSTWTCTRSTS